MIAFSIDSVKLSIGLFNFYWLNPYLSEFKADFENANRDLELGQMEIFFSTFCSCLLEKVSEGVVD